MHLQGAAKQISTGGPNPSLIATLPVAARPTRNVFTIVHTFAGTYADLAITPSGQILVIAPRSPAVEDLSFLSLEGITYQAPGPKSFGLRVDRLESRGATVIAVLRVPRVLVLRVARVTSHGLVLVGLVRGPSSLPGLA